MTNLFYHNLTRFINRHLFFDQREQSVLAGLSLRQFDINTFLCQSISKRKGKKLTQ